MKGRITLALAPLAILFAGCGTEGTPDSAETVKEIQAQNRPEDPPVPEHIRARGGATPARGSGAK